MKSAFVKNYNIVLVSLLLFFLAINYDVLLDLYRKWNPKDYAGPYSHGPLVAIIVLYLLYNIIKSNKKIFVPTSSMLGIILLLGSQLLLLIAKLGGVNFAQHIALLVSLLAIVWASYSFRVTKRFILPAILFSLTFPVWGDAEFPLQKVAVFTTNALLGLTSLPYYHQGPYFHFPNGIIEIAPECAGLQQLLVSLILGLLFSMQHRLRPRDTIKTLIYISIMAIFINTIRIIVIMYVGYYTKMESSLISKHILLGWVIYGIGIFIFLYFYSRVKFKPADNTYDVTDDNGMTKNSSNFVVILYFVVPVLILFPSISTYAITQHINNQPVNSIHYQVESPDWHKSSDQISIHWIPQFPAADAVATATFNDKYSDVYVYIFNYVHIHNGVEPINMDNVPFNRDNWSVLQRKMLAINPDNGERKSVKLDYLRSKGNQHLLVLYYYLVNGKIVDSLAGAKLARLTGMMKLHYDVKVVCLATLRDVAHGGGQSRLHRFLQTLRIN